MTKIGEYESFDGNYGTEVRMIICDRAYLRGLESRMKKARKKLPPEVADAIDREIETIEAQGDPWYGTRVITLAFHLESITKGSLFRIQASSAGFQGNLRKFRSLSYGTWFEACAVNKDTRRYRTWVDPDDAIQALYLAHRIVRYKIIIHNTRGLSSLPRQGQIRIDKWRIEHGNTKRTLARK